VLAERHDRELRQRPGPLRLVKVRDPGVHPLDVPRPAPSTPLFGWDERRRLAIRAEAQSRPSAEVPKEPGARRAHLPVAGQDAMLRVALDPGALVVVRRDRRIAPAMAVDAHLAIAVEVVEEHVVAGE